MKTSAIVLFAVLTATSAPAAAEIASPTFSVGLTVMKHHFNEAEGSGFDVTDCLFSCSRLNLDDDSDAGGELYFKARWSPLWTWKLGFADQGEFSFVGDFDNPEARGTGEVCLGYAAWAPQWNITDRFAVTGAIGAGWQDIDANVQAGFVDIDDGWASYTTLGVEYRASRHFGVQADPGYSFASGDIDVGWLGVGGSYTF